ncbi:MAG: hypothetical protein ACKV2T_29195 [Kofleriaceae bacterium]
MNLVDTARRIAKSHPDAILPCPLCASSVKGDNLASHLTKVHPDTPIPRAAIPSDTIVTVPAWRGSDARAVVTLLIGLVPFGAAAVATIALAQPRVLQIASLVAFAFVLVLVFAAWFRKIPARLALAENAIVMRGLVARRSVDLPCAIEAGTIRDSRPDATYHSADHNTPSVSFDAGTYLCFTGPRELVVACRAKASHLGAPKGRKRTSWDIELPREAFVALQYALVERGLLAVGRGDLALTWRR